LSALCKSSSNPKVLLYGPSGCGKTYLCRALANETDINFLALRAGDFLDLSFEESELKLAHMLQFARENKPAVIFIDEYEWLGADAEKLGLDTETALFRNNLLNLLLDSINGNYFANGNIALIAVTNKPWLLDQSFLTAGKIDKHIYVPAPSVEDKAEILKVAFSERSNEFTDYKNLKFSQIAKKTQNISSGAEVEMFVDSVVSEIFLDKVLNSQTTEPTDTKEKVTIISTDRIKKSIKNFNYSSVDCWLKLAKTELKNRKNRSNLFVANRFWQNIQEHESKRKGFLSRTSNKLLNFFGFGV
jgi:SpoVK/Ycf46/Vps4 family AAA+-type ATPase